MHAAAPQAQTAFDEQKASIASSMRALSGTGMPFCGGWRWEAGRDVGGEEMSHRRIVHGDSSAEQGVNVTARGAFLQRRRCRRERTVSLQARALKGVGSHSSLIAAMC